MGKKRGDNWPTEYIHIVHATELERRKRYHGCVSRQTLRVQLRKDAQMQIRAENPKMNHAEVRMASRKAAGLEYAKRPYYCVAAGDLVPDWRKQP